MPRLKSKAGFLSLQRPFINIFSINYNNFNTITVNSKDIRNEHKQRLILTATALTRLDSI